ncbi:MAG: sugar phosphate isomerase/epimerase [Candidatus Krumholzibacteriota bacterium]|nr:sugar phosphate isomerase/epimerase [Candidatus Krumholzibacteriota bacterium]
MDFYVSVPLSRFESSIDYIKREGFQPEIRMTDVNFMLCQKEKDLARMREIIEKNSFSVFTHGPFFGLDAASLDRNLSEYSIRSLIHGLKTTRALGGRIMVMHTGYLPQFSRGGRRHWFRNWARNMPQVVDKAEEFGVILALENTWDDRPEILLHLAGLLPGGRIRFCLDTGHVNAFSRRPLKQWMDAVWEGLVALHLHDNDGLSDDHLPPGKGTFDFKELFGILKEKGIRPLLDIEVDFPGAPGGRAYLEKMLEENG